MPTEPKRRQDDKPLNQALRWGPLVATLIAIIGVSVTIGQRGQELRSLGDKMSTFDRRLDGINEMLRHDYVTRHEMEAILKGMKRLGGE